MIEQWVNDQLYDVLGLSDKTAVEFLIGLAKRSSSEGDFEQRLRNTGTIDINENVLIFSRKLFQRVRDPVSQKVVTTNVESGTDKISDEGEFENLKARDEFVQRLREKDLTGSVEKNLQPKVLSVADLRQESRFRYLKRRKEQKLDNLEEGIKDDEHLFQQNKLTEREKKEREYKKEVIALARACDRVQDLENVPRYYIPEDRKEIKPDLEKPCSSDQMKWEEQQMSFANLKLWPSGPEKKGKRKEYEIILDEEVEIAFVQAHNSIPGNQTKEKSKLEETEIRKKRLTIREETQNLPIYPFKEDLIQAVRDHQILIIEGETGSGKTTQIPQYLNEAGFCAGKKKIGCTQPRRLAAINVAARVAEEMEVRLGNEVGYSIRFEDRTSEKTMLKYMTDGLLLREFLREPDLNSYSVIIIDEAHERSLHTDLLFGLVKDVARSRPDLKVLITSATIDAEKFSEFFDNAPVFRIPGRRYPVDIYYTKAPEADYIAACTATILLIHATQPMGDILVFLPGQEEIESCSELLLEKTKRLGSQIKELVVLPLYANLPSDLQAKIFEPTPTGARKVILATNIAETSLTIDGIIYVIDSGFCKETSYSNGMDSLIVVPISKASANQRAGRAGRVAHGKCFRLYTPWAFKNELPENQRPEIQRVDLANVVQLMKSLGIDDLVNFDFIDPPPQETLSLALEQLYALGALNHLGELTKLGRKMAEFPVEPMLSKTLIASEGYKCSNDILSIAAMLSVNGAIFYRPKDKIVEADTARKNFFTAGGDHLTLLKIYNEWAAAGYSTQWCYENFIQHKSMKKARDIREQFEGLMRRVEIEILSNPTNTVNIRKAITAGYFYHTARLSESGHYKSVKHGQSVTIHPNSTLIEDLPKWLIYHELVFTTKEFMREVIEIESSWLLEVAPHYYKAKDLEILSKKMPKVLGV